MASLLKHYSTFFLIQLDQMSLQSFQLPSVLEPASNPDRFYQICFLFLMPEDRVFQVSEARLPLPLRRQLYRQGAHIHPSEVDVDDPGNQLPKNCVIINQQSEQTLAFILGILHVRQADFARTIVFSSGMEEPRNLMARLSFFDLTSGKSPAFMHLRDLEYFNVGASGQNVEDQAQLRTVLNSVGAGLGSGGNALRLNALEKTLKDLVKSRCLGHLTARDSILAKDVTRFCNQLCAQITGVSSSKEILNKGYNQTDLSPEVKVKISLTILKELIEEGHIINRHIQTLFEENAISSIDDLQIQDLAFQQLRDRDMFNGLDDDSSFAVFAETTTSKKNKSQTLQRRLQKPASSGPSASQGGAQANSQVQRGAWSEDIPTRLMQQSMTMTLAKEIMEKYFLLHKNTNTKGIKKVKSLLEMLKTWTKNAVTKLKMAKNSYLPENHSEFLKIFDEKHERVVAFNVILALFKSRVIMYENSHTNVLSHNLSKVEQSLKIVNGMVEAGGPTKDQLLGQFITMQLLCFNDVQIEKVWILSNDKLNDSIKKLLTGQLEFDQQPPKPEPLPIAAVAMAQALVSQHQHQRLQHQEEIKSNNSSSNQQLSTSGGGASMSSQGVRFGTGSAISNMNFSPADLRTVPQVEEMKKPVSSVNINDLGIDLSDDSD